MPGHNSRNSPATQGPRHISEVIRQETHFQGPLPPPEAFAAYDRVLHGAADRILSMAENQASHRQGLERRALAGDLIKAMMGTILAYITFAGAMGGAVYLLANDKPLYGLAALVTAPRRRLRPKNLRRLHPTQSHATGLEFWRIAKVAKNSKT
jgi:hypothetical protein